MTALHAPVTFFLGANTPAGFVGFTNELYDVSDGWQVYLIKSGPGTGKSSLMKKIYKRLLPLEPEVIVCSSDPSSLDGLIYPTLKRCILDATAPHVAEPHCWGAVEQIVPLSWCVDETAMRPFAGEILAATEDNREGHRRCCNYLRAAAALLRENRRLGEVGLDREKITRLAARIAEREFTGGCGKGRITHRFLSAITPLGHVVQAETLQTLCPRIYTVEDEQGAAARLLLSELENRAQAAGVEGIACPCPLFPNDGAEHLLFPSLGVGFTTSNSFHKADFPVYRRIHAGRFATGDAPSKKQLQNFNRRAARELVRQACTLSAQAKEAHDRMESYSIAAMDWERANEMGERIVRAFEDAARRHC